MPITNVIPEDNLNDVVVRIPEYILYYGLKSAVDFLRSDFAVQTDETKSLLYMILNNVGINRYEFFKQAKKVFLAGNDDPRYFSINMMYNMEKNAAPSVYITLPADQSAQNELSVGEGANDPYFIDSTDDTQGTYQPSLSRRFQATYSIVITSDNENEVILIYHVLRALLISMHVHFNLAGLVNISLGGADLKPYNKDIPHNAFVRAINFNCQYETGSYDFSKYPMFNQMVFNGTPYLNGS